MKGRGIDEKENNTTESVFILQRDFFLLHSDAPHEFNKEEKRKYVIFYTNNRNVPFGVVG